MKLTEAEIEMIALKREEDAIKAKQDALKADLEYSAKLHRQTNDIDSQRKVIESRNERIITLYNKLCKLGVKEYVIKKEILGKISSNSYITEDLKPEDVINEEISRIQLETKWGTLYDVDIDGKCQLPSDLSTRWQSYKPETIATKILEKIQQEQRIKTEKEIQDNYINNLIEDLKISSPTGTIFTKQTEYVRNQYTIKGSNGYYQNQLKIEYPNKSWVILNVYQTSWDIKNKFDSKYIKPETKEAWLEYLAKE